MENVIPPVYAGIIDDIGRRLYSGNITWLREYVQNAIDGGSPSIEIKIHGNDLEILDYGKGMDGETLLKQAFGIGKSLKEKDEIGELGIGMYAGSGICDTLIVRTKMIKKKVYIAKLDMKEYRRIIDIEPRITFFDMMEKILKIEEDKIDDSEESFTHLRFEGLNRDMLNLIGRTNLSKFLEYTLNVPIDGTFQHIDSLKKFMGNISKEISVILDIDGKVTQITKFRQNSISFADTFWSKDIVEDNGNIIGKVWATYNASGLALPDARILVKRKGLTIGDEKIVVARFEAKYSPRFYGEIILLDDRVEINTSRDWFVSSQYLTSFVEKAKALLNELYGIADFDSRDAVGIINLANDNIKLERGIATNSKKKNIGLVVEKRGKIEKNNDKIYEKIREAQEFKEKVKRGVINTDDPTNRLKLELVNRALGNPNVKQYLENEPNNVQSENLGKPKKSAWPEIVISFLKKNLIDKKLAERIGDGDVKDTSDRAFTFIEQKLKQILGIEENKSILFNELLAKFKENYKPPDLHGMDMKQYMQAFDGILNGTHTILRNPSNHSFMDDMNNSRYTMEIILIADFIVHWLDQWTSK